MLTPGFGPGSVTSQGWRVRAARDGFTASPRIEIRVQRHRACTMDAPWTDGTR
jgi:hypothetical protein